MFSELLSEWGEKKYRIDQVNHGIFRELHQSFDEMTALSKSLRERLSQEAVFSVLELVRHTKSKTTD